MQQCSECRISRICVPHSRSFKRNSIAASYQHHAGLQPANLVTSPTVSCSRRSDLFRCSVFFTLLLQFIPYIPASVVQLYTVHYYFLFSSPSEPPEQSSAAVQLIYFYAAVRSSLQSIFIQQSDHARGSSSELFQQ